MSGVLAMLMTGAATVVLHSDTVSNSAAAPGSATASITIGSTGLAVEQLGDLYSSYTWLKSGNASNYEILATLNSGSVTGDSFGAWLNLGTSRSWSLTRSTFGTSTGSITIQIRPVGGSAIAAAGISFSADVS